MEFLLQSIREVLDNPAGARWTSVAAVGIAVFLFALGISLAVARITDPVRRRLAGMLPESQGGPEFGARIAAILAPVARYVLPTKESEVSEVGRRLYFAGFRSPSAPSVFYAIKTTLALVLPACWLGIASTMPGLSSQQVMLFTVMAAAIGLFVPNYVVDHLAARHRKKLRDGFPDALDMLVVCVEAGLGLSAALQRVADELAVSHPDLASELSLVNAEIRAGVDREVALRNFATRTGLEDARGLVGLLIQTLRFGTSIADALRVYSEEFRDKRMQKAEEEAAKVGTKLIFPLVLCLFPGFFVVAVGPAIIRIIEAFSNLGAGK
jgi:tight adherence protein C